MFWLPSPTSYLHSLLTFSISWNSHLVFWGLIGVSWRPASLTSKPYLHPIFASPNRISITHIYKLKLQLASRVLRFDWCFVAALSYITYLHPLLASITHKLKLQLTSRVLRFDWWQPAASLTHFPHSNSNSWSLENFQRLPQIYAEVMLPSKQWL